MKASIALVAFATVLTACASTAQNTPEAVRNTPEDFAAALVMEPDRQHIGNNDGMISRAEFAATAGNHFDRQDTNRDGELGGAERFRPDSPRTRAAYIRQAEGVFDQLDTNHDGVQSGAEITAMRNLMAPTARLAQQAAAPQAPRQAPAQPQRPDYVTELDTNHDGAISRDEYNAMQTDHFNRQDINHDGQLSAEESRTGPPMTRAEYAGRAFSVFDGADANRDGALRGDEITALRDAVSPASRGPAS